MHLWIIKLFTSRDFGDVLNRKKTELKWFVLSPGPLKCTYNLFHSTVLTFLIYIAQEES